ncbi:MAG: T9SS C-terminal target domain-containing protein [Calditrichaeota bacterium]|nr:MAG: T9SS C-terminal target domain-containing protein [Calditrichota bacterium]MBL1207924.1 T9SS C-terminal target domain-containing protein [Calditrichota bacterium]NOG47759.1 T9SS type A sorting domain-containing protein [Calditrichota bacterium]
MKLCIYTSISVLLISGFAFSQVTINPDDLLGLIGKSGTVEEDTSGFINVSPGPAGANQTWDFSTTSLVAEESIMEFLDPKNTCCADSFPSSNFANLQYYSGENPDSVYGYFEVTSSSIYFFGVAGKEDDSTSVLFLDEDIAPLPLNYGASWTSVSSDTFFGGVFAVVFRDSTYSEVDAWGSITVPAGTFESLRIRDNYTEYEYVYFDGSIVSSDTSTTINYEWVTKNNFLAATMESQDGETNPNFSMAAYMSRLKSSGPTSIADHSHLNNPNSFELFQNYPNPFNPETVIKFNLAQVENVRLDVFDTNGKRIKSLVNGQKSAGIHSIIWNGKNADGINVASGIYYYSLSIAGKKIAHRKMVLIR